jgi:Carboxypeptidase regulatory-like domain
MTTLQFRILCHAFLCVAIVCTAQTQSGSVSGSVYNASGEPIKDAAVNIRNLAPSMHHVITYYHTDTSGQFRIDHVPFGRYAILARKESDDYPDTNLAFYSQDRFEEVTLTPEHRDATVKLVLNARAASLDGSVRDAATGEQVPATMTLCRVEEPSLWISTSIASPYSVLVPADTNVAIAVSKPGFATWFASNVVRLRSGERLVINISLVPEVNSESEPPSEPTCLKSALHNARQARGR